MPTSLAPLFRELAQPVAREFPAGATIFRDGDPAGQVYVVERGRVRLVRFTPEGTKLIPFTGGWLPWKKGGCCAGNGSGLPFCQPGREVDSRG